MVSPVTARVKARLIQALVSQLLPLLEQLAAYDKEIMRLFTRSCRRAGLCEPPGQGSGLRHACWRVGATTKPALPARRACKDWRAPRQ